MKNYNIAVVGFFGSGSSAITDLLKEYSGCSIALNTDERGIERPYEHKLLYTRGGIFETSFLLSHLNSAYTSDIYINSFRVNMQKMYRYNFVSFGSYEKVLGKSFLNSIDKFCSDVGAVKLQSGISRTEHKKSVRFSPIMALLQIGAKIVYKKPIYKLGKKNIMDKNPYYFAMPEQQVVQEASRDFIKRYFDMCRGNYEGILIFDQLIHAQHTSIVDYFFDDDFKAIIIRRDPRDLYCLSKYVWSKPPHGFSAPLPVDIDEFCSFWKKTTNYDMRDTNKVLNIAFEDLIYKYDETRKKIELFLELTDHNHIAPLTYFDPNKSIRNTQIFERSEEMKEEGKRIAELLPDLLYNFPYRTEYAMNDIFEDTNETRKEK